MEKLRLKPLKSLQTAKWPLKEQVAFFDILADLLTAGFSLKQSLQEIGLFLPKLKLSSVLENLSQGQELSKALEDKLPNSLYCQLVIAEKHGDLKQSITQLGHYLKQRVRQKEKLQSLLLYPLLILFLLCLLLIALKVWLFPEIARFASSTSSNDPFWYFEFLKGILLGILGAVILVLFIALAYLKSCSTLKRHEIYSHLPIIGGIYRQYSSYYLTFNLGLLYKSGLEFKQICELLQQFDSSSLLYQLGEDFEKNLEQGKELSVMLKKYSFIPDELALFFQTGKTKDKLGKDLLVYSKLAYERLLEKADNLLAWVQPTLFLIIALVIIGTYLALLLPLYSSLGGISQS